MESIPCALTTREECTALATAMSIRARARLAEVYANLYESWIADERVMRPRGEREATGSAA